MPAKCRLSQERRRGVSRLGRLVCRQSMRLSTLFGSKVRKFSSTKHSFPCSSEQEAPSKGFRGLFRSPTQSIIGQICLRAFIGGTGRQTSGSPGLWGRATSGTRAPSAAVEGVGSSREEGRRFGEGKERRSGCGGLELPRGRRSGRGAAVLAGRGGKVEKQRGPRGVRGPLEQKSELISGDDGRRRDHRGRGGP